MTSSSYQWKYDKNQARCYKGKQLVFSDTLDHFQNGFCRLPNLTTERAQAWVETANDLGEQLNRMAINEVKPEVAVSLLKAAWQKLYPESAVDTGAVNLKKAKPGPCGHRPDSVWASAIGEDPNYAVVHCSKCLHGWLVERRDPGKVLHDIVEYEEEYFEGDKKRLGYGSYIKQQGWRLEKAERLLRQLQAALLYRDIKLPRQARLLDVGSGYGFFRASAAKLGWKHQGIEISQHAADVTKQLFKFPTFVGVLDDFAATSTDKFDVITLYDVIEHVERPLETLKLIKGMLNDGGVCVLRTPNLHSIESEIFGNLFYSLKKEHYNLFSAQSLSLFCSRAGLKPVLTTTTAHYLEGIIGSWIHYHEAILSGSDILVVAQK